MERPLLRSTRVALVGLAVLTAAPAVRGDTPPQSPYAEVAAVLDPFIRAEVETKHIPALSIALVDGDRVVWSRGYGFADPKAKRPATADTIYRVGSVSKLFTDLALMRLVEQAKIDLDAPVAKAIPGFAPKNPYNKPITLRQMTAHRSGLVRESPVGHYFDPTEPSLAATVASLNSTSLVYEPETRTKYSNAAIATVGLAVELAAGEPFAAHMRRVWLGPLGMTRSDFEATPAIKADLARATMWGIDGRTFEAPTFALGTAPAGNLYASVTDLGKFLSFVFAGGKTPAGPLVMPETLKLMTAPQFRGSDGARNYGIGFALGTLEGRPRIGHSGAVYGFATELAALPEEKLGVAVCASLDCANSTTRRIGDAALIRMLAVKRGAAIRPLETTRPVDPAEAARLAGRYVDGDQEYRLEARDGGLFLTPPSDYARVAMRKLGDDLVIDDPRDYGDRLKLDGASAAPGNRALRRAEDPMPEPPAERLLGLIGEYGWDHNVMYIHERNGRLYALIEWFFLYPLTELSADVFAFPASGLYDGEKLVFTRGADGKATQVETASVVFKRRPISGEDGATFRIRPVRPVADLRVEALKAQPPAETGDFRTPDLVEPTKLDPSIRLDIRYAGENNFAGTPFYSRPRAFLQRPAAEALVRAHRALAADGLGLLIHDAYRPWYVTKMFWDATPPENHAFVADPSKGSKHNRGAAVDLTLYDLKSGQAVPMVGTYDEFSDRSRPDYPGGTSRQRWSRDRLRHVMEQQGFTVNEVEWWHFDYEDWSKYPILNKSFEELGR